MVDFPDVPNVPGVPPLLGSGSSIASLVLLVADTVASLFAGAGEPQWGIFLDGLAIIPYDSEVSFDYKKDYSVSDYTIEQGGFESYDKVEHPFDVKIRLATGGSLANRQAFLAALDAVIADTNLYDAVVPETVYTDVNFTHYDLHREAQRGATLLIVDLWGIQIRQAGSSTFSSTNTQQPSGANTVAAGGVQTQPTSAAQITAVQQAMGNGGVGGVGNGGTGW